MPDITMCSGDGCSTKESCYRFTAPINEYAQSYFMEVPGKDKSCDSYWERVTDLDESRNKQSIRSIYWHDELWKKD